MIEIKHPIPTEIKQQYKDTGKKGFEIIRIPQEDGTLKSMVVTHKDGDEIIRNLKNTELKQEAYEHV